MARVLETHGLPPERARSLAALAEGAPGRALALEGEEIARVHERLLPALDTLRDVPAAAISSLAQELARGPLDAALSAVVAWYRDVLQTALVGDELPLRNPSFAPAVRTAAARLSPAARLRQLEVVCDTLDGLGRNANRMLAVETMLLWLREVERGIPPQGATWASGR